MRGVCSEPMRSVSLFFCCCWLHISCNSKSCHTTSFIPITVNSENVVEGKDCSGLQHFLSHLIVRDISSSLTCDRMKNSESSEEDGSRELIRRLLVWKRRLYDDECTIEKFTNFDDLCDPSLFSLGDSVCRRSLFLVIGKLVQLCWEATNFGRVPLQPIADRFVNRLFPILHRIVDSIEFDSGAVWFGGISGSVQSQRSSSEANNSSIFVSICVQVAALLARTYSSDALSHLLRSLVRFVDSSQRLVNSLIEHDERCLSCAVAIQHLSSSQIEMPMQFDVATLFCAIIYQIAFDHTVIIDWLQSELAAVPFLLRFLSDMSSNLHRYEEAARSITGAEEADEEPQICFDPWPVSENADDTVLTIVQLHGQQEITSSYRFSKTAKIL
uniref:Protein Lines C-terminal domain-containing protein n=1 Tax=Parascaris univalens TaxID=6257 RepID=A0A915AWQ0_PARUN